MVKRKEKIKLVGDALTLKEYQKKWDATVQSAAEVDMRAGYPKSSTHALNVLRIRSCVGILNTWTAYLLLLLTVLTYLLQNNLYRQIQIQQKNSNGTRIKQIHPAIPLFPEHIDFEKVGEIYIRGEKHCILKARKHTIIDQFDEYYNRRENKAKKPSIDRKGMKHYYTNLGYNETILKEADILSAVRNLVARKYGTNETDIKDVLRQKGKDQGKKATTTKAPAKKAPAKKAPAKQAPAKKATTKKETAKMNTPKKDTLKKETLKNTIKKDTAKFDTLKNTMKKDTPIKDAAKNTVKPSETTATKAGPIKTALTGERTLARAQFYCPFIGVMTLSAFLD